MHVDENITTIMVTGLVEQEQSYSCIVILETIAGSVCSDVVTLSKCQHSVLHLKCHLCHPFTQQHLVVQ